MDAKALRYLRSLVPKGSRILRARSEAEFLRRLPEATHAIVWNFKREWFARSPRLKVLATPAAGQEFVPTKGPKGVKIHFGHYHGRIISEAVAGFMLSWAKGFFLVPSAPRQCRAWPRTWLSDKCFDVAGTQAMIVGYGHLGRAIGKKLRLLGVEVTGITRHRIFGCGSFHDADWLIFALPSTTATDNYLDAQLIRRLPRRCVVINVGRGNAVDERCLYQALKSRRLAGAYLDVRKHEPSATALESPGYEPKLSRLENCISMPHSAAFSRDYINLAFKELYDDGCL